MSELPPEGYPEGSRRVWGLTMGTKILEFRQTPQGREFSYLGYF